MKFNNEEELYKYLNKNFGDNWSNDIVIHNIQNSITVIAKLKYNSITRVCQHTSSNIEDALIHAMTKCIKTFVMCESKEEIKENKEEKSFVIPSDEPEEIEFTEENYKKQVTEYEQTMKEIKESEEKEHPLVKKGLIRKDQLDFLQEFTKTYEITSEEKFSYYLKNWGEWGGDPTVTTKVKLINAGISVIDNFINFIKKTGTFHQKGIQIPNID